jgi:hypothetical protein
MYPPAALVADCCSSFLCLSFLFPMCRVQKSSAAISAYQEDYEVGWRCEGKLFFLTPWWMTAIQFRSKKKQAISTAHALLPQQQKKLDFLLWTSLGLVGSTTLAEKNTPSKSNSTGAQYAALHWKSWMRCSSHIQWSSGRLLETCTSFRAVETV